MIGKYKAGDRCSRPDCSGTWSVVKDWHLAIGRDSEERNMRCSDCNWYQVEMIDLAEYTPEEVAAIKARKD
jgi:hypothetical protein